MDHIRSAIERGAPFSVLMADGKEYRVPHRDYISISPTGQVVVVYSDTGHVWVLPLRTITGLAYQSSETEPAAT